MSGLSEGVLIYHTHMGFKPDSLTSSKSQLLYLIGIECTLKLSRYIFYIHEQILQNLDRTSRTYFYIHLHKCQNFMPHHEHNFQMFTTHSDTSLMSYIHTKYIMPHHKLFTYMTTKSCILYYTVVLTCASFDHLTLFHSRWYRNTSYLYQYTLQIKIHYFILFGC